MDDKKRLKNKRKIERVTNKILNIKNKEKKSNWKVVTK